MLHNLCIACLECGLIYLLDTDRNRSEMQGQTVQIFSTLASFKFENTNLVPSLYILESS